MATHAGSGTGNGNAQGERAAGAGHEAWAGEGRGAEMIDKARTAATDLYEQLDVEGRVRRNPYGMMAAALGIGFVLGGGLTTGLGRRLLGLGMKTGIRLVLVPLLADELWGVAQRMGIGSSREKKISASQKEGGTR